VTDERSPAETIVPDPEEARHYPALGALRILKAHLASWYDVWDQDIAIVVTLPNGETIDLPIADDETRDAYRRSCERVADMAALVDEVNAAASEPRG